jgi:4-carboxymuconolactone decarboxylase
MPETSPQSYIDSMAGSRGYVPTYHRVMAYHDFDVLQAMNRLAHATYEEERDLDQRTKQLLFITALTVTRAGPEFLTSHIHRGLDLGLTPRAILEAIEIALPISGIVTFLAGFEAWRKVTAAQGLEPTNLTAEPGA